MSRQMKESGSLWLGQIPDNWGRLRLKYSYDNSNGSAVRVGPFGSALPSSDYVSEGEWVYNQRTVLDENFETNDTCVTKEKANSLQGFKVKPGDILITTRGTLGHIAIVPENAPSGILHPCIIRFRVKNSVILPELLKYMFNYGDYFMKQIEYENNSTTIGALYSYNLKDLVLPFIPIDEQRQIVSFLDRKCSAIDTAIEKTKESIEKMEEYKKAVITKAVTKGLDPDAKMKDSGVEWIKEIPENWDILRGKFIFKKLSRPVKETDDVITCFRDGEVTLRKNRREEGFTFSDKEIGYQGIEPGDLVVHGMDGFAGSIGISDSRGKATPVLNVLDSTQNKKYYMYYLRSMAYGDVFNAIATGIRVRSCNLNWNKLAELSYPVPSKETQKAIVDYIDDKLAKTDALIAKKQEAISKWEEYKKSLIYYAVTGKIDCRNEAI